MLSPIEQLRSHNLAQFMGIRTIKTYQNTISKVTPSRCRYTPSCSQYGIDAISEWGLIEGVKLTRQRMKRCHRPNGGYNPVPFKQTSQRLSRSRYLAAKKVTNSYLDSSNFKTIKKRDITDNFIDYDHHFRLILSYPKKREFISIEDFREKILELNQYVFEVSDYALLYRIAKIEIGVIGDYYLLRFAATMSDCYLENSIDEVIQYIIEQLAGFLLVAKAQEFEPLYFQVDGQTYIEAKPQQKAVPASYQQQKNFWDYTSNTGIYDVYWGNFVFDLFRGVAEISGLVPDLLSSGIDSGFVNMEDSTGDGCDLDGCDSIF